MTVLHFGSAPVQFASELQPGPHVCVWKLQMPFAPRHCAFDVHCTHSCVRSLQTGAPGRHAETLKPLGPSLHSKHEPETHAGAVWRGHASVAGGEPAVPLSALHAAHLPFDVLQTGFGPVATQFPLLVHSTQVFVVVLQTGVEPVHCLALPALHWTHTPVAMLQAGAAAVGHAFVALVPLSPSHFTHVPEPVLQTGLSGAVHCELVRQPTHTFFAVSQNGVAPPHVELSTHWTQRPALHFVADGEVHCESLKHVDVHTWALQKGFATGQSVPALHSTQRWFVVSQAGLPGMSAHAVSFDALHCSHVPGPFVGTHAGSVAVGHFALAVEPKSPLHGLHVSLAHTGVADGQVELDVQFTHTLVARSQTVLFGSVVHVTGTPVVFELHSAHAPLGRQAGFACEHGNWFDGPGVEP